MVVGAVPSSAAAMERSLEMRWIMALGVTSGGGFS